jgi:lipopolysaccharide biosynthesis glycosyltransferase
MERNYNTVIQKLDKYFEKNKLDSPKENTIPIFVASDDGYAPFVGVTATSIMENTNSQVYLYVLDSGISEHNKERLRSIERTYSNFLISFIEVNLQDLFGAFKLHNKSHTLNVYSRYLIPGLAKGMEKVIYMDVDVVVRGDIQKLYNEDLGKYSIGAIPEYTNVLDEHKKELGLSRKHKYFNAGVLLLNIKEFHKKNILKDIVRMTLDIKPKYQDQDIFNLYFENNYKIFDSKYNVSYWMWKYNQEEPLKEITDSITNPFIIHYTTFKPWKDLNVMMGSYFWRYARMSTFYEQILMNFIDKKMKRLLDVNTEGPKEESKRISKVMLGRKIRLLEIRERKNEVEYYLFARIPLLKIRTREKYKDIYLISWRLHILRINYK